LHGEVLEALLFFIISIIHKKIPVEKEILVHCHDPISDGTSVNEDTGVGTFILGNLRIEKVGPK
jgi:hypothetical protein